MPYEAHLDGEAGMSDKQAAELLGVSVHTLRTFRFQGPPHSGPKFIKLNKRVIYRRKDLLAWRDSEGFEAVMVGEVA